MSALAEIRTEGAQDNPVNSFYVNSITANELDIKTVSVTDLTFSQLIPDDATGHQNVMITNSLNAAQNSTQSTIVGSITAPASTSDVNLSLTVMLGNDVSLGTTSNQGSTIIGSNITLQDNHNDVIAIGSGVFTQESNQAVIGSSIIGSIISLGENGSLHSNSCDIGTEDNPFGAVFCELVNTDEILYEGASNIAIIQNPDATVSDLEKPGIDEEPQSCSLR